MTIAQTQVAEFRKGQRGQWVVYGLFAELNRKAEVRVAKRDGSVTTVTLSRVVAAAVPGMAWGEIMEAAKPARARRLDHRCKDPMGDGYVNCLCRDCR